MGIRKNPGKAGVSVWPQAIARGSRRFLFCRLGVAHCYGVKLPTRLTPEKLE
jgi:hypothetical protein